MTNKMICISCPIGCHLEVTQKDGDISVKNNKCSRGEIYGKEEILAPKRVVTATCPTDSRLIPRVPVKTSAPIRKELINNLLDELYRYTVKTPVQCGEKIFENYFDSGIDVVVTKTLLS